MDKIKCITSGCKSNRFYLLAEKKHPAQVNEHGDIVSDIIYTYKCVECNQTFASNMGPDSPKKKLLNG